MAGNGNGTNGTLASNREAMDRFLDKLRNSGNVRLSCRAAGVPRRTAYNWRNRWVTFADEWDEALEDACDILEAEAWKRAIEKQSDRLLMFLLKAHRPEKFKERTKTDMEVSGPDGGPIRTEDVTLSDVERLEKLAAIFDAAGARQGRAADPGDG